MGIKISPFNPYGDIVLDNSVETYLHLIEELNKLDFAYVELMRHSQRSALYKSEIIEDEIEFFGSKIRQIVIANGGYDKVSAEAELEKGIA